MTGPAPKLRPAPEPRKLRLEEVPERVGGTYHSMAASGQPGDHSYDLQLGGARWWWLYDGENRLLSYHRWRNHTNCVEVYHGPELLARQAAKRMLEGVAA